MIISEFAKPVTAKTLNESLAKRFGAKLNLEKFTLEQLQNARNKLRTQVFNVETNESFDNVHNETYQKSKLMLDVLNAEISERGDIEIPEDSQVNEGAEDQAELVMAAKEMVDRLTGWMEDTAEMQTESMLELADAIRDEMGAQQSEGFTNAVKPALEQLYAAMESTRVALTQGVGMLTGEGAAPAADMGAELPVEEPVPGAEEMEPTVDTDEFAAASPAAGVEEEAGRERRESRNYAKKKMIETSRRLGSILSSR